MNAIRTVDDFTGNIIIGVTKETWQESKPSTHVTIVMVSIIWSLDRVLHAISRYSHIHGETSIGNPNSLWRGSADDALRKINVVRHLQRNPSPTIGDTTGTTSARRIDCHYGNHRCKSAVYRPSSPSGFWQKQGIRSWGLAAIVQVSVSSDTRWILDQANGLTDSEVSQLPAGKDPKIKVGRSVETGMVEILEGPDRYDQLEQGGMAEYWEKPLWPEEVRRK